MTRASGEALGGRLDLAAQFPYEAPAIQKRRIGALAPR